MFKNQEGVVINEAELALLASISAQHVPPSQTAIDPEFQQFMLRLMLQSGVLTDDNLAGKQNQT